MTGRLRSWMVALLLLGTMAYALAEEITLTTYYPSPRGVYDELRTAGDVAIGKLDAPNARLEIRGRTLGTSEKALAVGNLDGAARLVVQDGGNVGIGIASPAMKLDVNGNVLVRDGALGPNVGIIGIGNVPEGLDINTANAAPLYLRTNSNVGIFINGSNQSVGIGTPTPSPGSVLDVAGKLIVDRSGRVGIGKLPDASFTVDVQGTVHATGIPLSSDVRFKTNIVPLTHALEKLERIRGVSFEWNGLAESQGAKPGEQGIGVLAQDVEPVFPELVTSWGDERYKAVDYGKLAAVLLEAIKELKKEKEALTKRLETLEAERSHGR